MQIEVSDDTPQVWKDLLEGLAMLSRGAMQSYPTHCEHDELTVCANPHKFNRDELFKLYDLGFLVSGHANPNDDGTLDEVEEQAESYTWQCDEECCDAYFKSYKYGSA